MDDLEEKDESKRKSRNLSEKKRRDQFNILITELGSMVSPNACSASRKMDKTTVLKSTIAYLRMQNESSAKSVANEIQENWKPSFLSNDEFTHLMLEAMESFILVFGIDGGIVYVSEGVTSLAGHLPKDLVECSIYEIIKESNKQDLYRFLATPKLDNAERIFTLHIRRGDHKVRWDLNRDMSKTPEPLDELEEEEDQYQLVRLTGFFRKWDMTIDNSNDASDDDCTSVKSGVSRISTNTVDNLSDLKRQQQQQQQVNLNPPERTVFVCTVRMLASQLLREVPLVNVSAKSEFVSRYSMEWKFLFLDHRAPQIIGYLPFELLGTSGYDYYHFDDLDRISDCHESLMQTGKATSCYHRFLSKGQQWIWLQTRYFITYHQWTSKPEFVVATHRVVNYPDVVKELKHPHQETKETLSEVESSDVKSTHYPTTGSPTLSSRSSLFGANSSTGTCNSSRVSENHPMGHVGGSSRLPGGGGGFSDPSDDCYSNEYDTLSQYMSSTKESKSSVIKSSMQAKPVPAAAPGGPQPVPVFLAHPVGHAPSEIPVMTSSGFQNGPVARPHLAMTSAQAQLHEQLRLKHSELSKTIAEQQEELRQISEQLFLMSQYGLVPATASGPTAVSVASGLPPGTSVGPSPVTMVSSSQGMVSARVLQPVMPYISVATPCFVSQSQLQFPTNDVMGPTTTSTTSVDVSGGGVSVEMSDQLAQPMVYTSITSETDDPFLGPAGGADGID